MEPSIPTELKPFDTFPLGQSGVHSFTPTMETAMLHNDWSQLAEEINRIVDDEPVVVAKPRVAFACVEPNLQGPPPPIYRPMQPPVRINNGGKTVVNCQFCAKNGEIRSVVSRPKLKFVWLLIFIYFVLSFRWNRTCCVIP